MSAESSEAGEEVVADVSVEEDDGLLGQFYVRGCCRLTTTALEARGLKMKLGSGTRNSYVQFRLGESKKTVDTPVIWKSLHPVWKEKNSFNFEVLRKTDKQGNVLEYEYLDVALWDKNAGVGDTFLGVDMPTLLFVLARRGGAGPFPIV